MFKLRSVLLWTVRIHALVVMRTQLHAASVYITIQFYETLPQFLLRYRSTQDKICCVVLLSFPCGNILLRDTIIWQDKLSDNLHYLGALFSGHEVHYRCHACKPVVFLSLCSNGNVFCEVHILYSIELERATHTLYSHVAST
jgi:hypothetical protein